MRGLPDTTVHSSVDALREPGAFNELAAAHYGIVYAVGLAHLRHPEEAEDLTQEVMLRAYLLIDELRSVAAFAPWICRIARNLAIDWQRLGKVKNRLAPHVPLETVPVEPESHVPDARQQVGARQTNAILMEHIQKLPVHLREVVLLHFMEGLTQAEVGEVLGISQGAVSSRINTALKKLRSVLGPILREGLGAMRPSAATVRRAATIVLACALLGESARAALAAKAATDMAIGSSSAPMLQKLFLTKWFLGSGATVLVVVGALVFSPIGGKTVEERREDGLGIPSGRFGKAPAGWTAMQTVNESFAGTNYDAAAGSLAVSIKATGKPVLRRAGWTTQRQLWMPYSSIGPRNVVRATFLVSRSGQSDMAVPAKVPNIRLRLANRFAVAAMLDVTSYRSGNAEANVAYAQAAPSGDASLPTSYTLTYDPVDVPFLAEKAETEGVLAGFEAYAREPQQEGTMALQEVQMSVEPVRAGVILAELKTGENDAGSLRAVNAAEEVQAFRFARAPTSGAGIAETRAQELLLDCTDDPYSSTAIATTGMYSEGVAGITLDTSQSPAGSRVAILRTFHTAANPGDRIHVRPGAVYRARFHLVGDKDTFANAQINLRASALELGWVQTLLMAGPYVTNGSNSELITRQTLPGATCMNPERTGNEPGGWYSVYFHAPVVDLPGSKLSELQLSCELIDTFSRGTLAKEERGKVTIDRIEVSEM